MLNRPKKRAILLVTTLIFSVLLMIALFASLQASRDVLFSAESVADVQQARAAAEAGKNYALARLQERPTWRGDGDGSTTTTLVTVNQADLYVLEDNGDVVGLMRDSLGRNSRFRIRFNYHDGNVGQSSDADGLDDPTTFPVSGPWVSVNNLGSNASFPVPRPTESGGQWEVSASSPMPFDVTSFTAYLVVEGLSGDGLSQQFSGGQANLAAPTKTVTKKVVEYQFQRQSASVADAASYSAGTLDVNLDNNGLFIVEGINSGDVGRVRSNEDVIVGSSSGLANYQSPGGEVYVASNSGLFELNGAPSTTPAPIQRTTPRGEFLELRWDDIRKAEAGSAEVRAGTYVWRETSASAPYLEYYAEDYDPVSGSYPAGSGTVITSGDQMIAAGPSTSINLAPGDLRLSITSDLQIQGTASGAQGFAVIPEDALTQSGRRPISEFVGGGTSNPIITSSGNVTFKGRVMGSGSVTTEGQITFQGSSALETGNNEVALYAKGDIVLEAIPDQVVNLGQVQYANGPGCVGGAGPASNTCTPTPGPVGPVDFGQPTEFQDQFLQGIVFTLGNFRADLTTATHRGNLTIQGIVAAYGGDPEAGEEPGANGGGRIDITAENAGFVYDSNALQHFLDLNSPTPLTTTFSAEI